MQQPTAQYVVYNPHLSYGPHPDLEQGSIHYNSNYSGPYNQMQEIPEDPPKKAIPEERRHAFVARVFSIVAVQLAVTTLTVVAAKLNLAGVQDFYRSEDGRAMLAVAMVGMVGTSLGAVCCCASALRTPPANWVILSVFTASTSYLVGSICLAYPAGVVVQALGITTGIVGALTAWAVTTKTDVTSWGSALAACGMGFLVMVIVGVFFESSLLQKLLALGGACLFSAYLCYDVQMVIGAGNHRQFTFDEDEYCLAALMIYLDIVNIMISILELLGGKGDGGE